MNPHLCVDCNKSTENCCSVCGRQVCVDCSLTNNLKNNFEKSEPTKSICSYCAEVYWRGF